MWTNVRHEFLVTFEFHQPYTWHVFNGNPIIMISPALCALPPPRTPAVAVPGSVAKQQRRIRLPPPRP